MLASEPPKYIADVDIRLLVNGLVLRVAQVCRDLIVLRDHAEIAAGEEAQLVVTVNGQDNVYPIVLPHGISLSAGTGIFF